MNRVDYEDYSQLFLLYVISVTVLFKTFILGNPYNLVQKQPPKVFWKKRCSWKNRKIQRKTPVPQSLF